MLKMLIFVFLFYMMMMFIYMFTMFMYFIINKYVIFYEYNLMKILSMKVELVLLIDWVSLLFTSVVILISMMVIYYSIEYMENDKKIIQFMLLIIMFVLSMLLMVMSPNFISILIGWDGLGLVSFCLVIYYQSKTSFNSGMVTVLTNRLGDILILMTISMLLSNGSWNFMFMEKMSNLMLLMLVIASFTKSAQLPFSSWLPLAMAAPTPVSALVHSSTLVTAGIYLIIRLNYIILNENLLYMIMLISSLTMFLAGLGANFEFDFKKIIALSTLSQLGLMFFCLSFKESKVALFHLLTHAMFKSLLFMCAGVIIHNMLMCQDIRQISMVTMNLPMISIMFICSTMSLCGIPFLSGFFSKDLILELYIMSSFNKFIFMVLYMSMGLTVSYSIRLIYYSFIKVPQINLYYYYDSSVSKMSISMYLLYLSSVMLGGILSWLMFSNKNSIYLTFKFKNMIYLFMGMGVLMGLMVSKFYFKYKKLIMMNKIYMFFSMMWFMPMLYTSWLPVILKFSSIMTFFFEMGWIEYIMGFNLINYLKSVTYSEENFKNNLLLILFIIVIFFIFMMF